MRRTATLSACFAGLFLLGLSFPRDHGSHPDATLEWWYWTGHLQSDDGRPYGFQLTFFRLRDLHLAHFAWSDVGGGSFRFAQKTHLGLPGIAGASESRLDAFNEDWFARDVVQGRAERGVGRQLLHARGPSGLGELSLTLTPEKAPASKALAPPPAPWKANRTGKGRLPS